MYGASDLLVLGRQTTAAEGGMSREYVTGWGYWTTEAMMLFFLVLAVSDSNKDYASVGALLAAFGGMLVLPLGKKTNKRRARRPVSQRRTERNNKLMEKGGKRGRERHQLILFYFIFLFSARRCSIFSRTALSACWPGV